MPEFDSSMFRFDGFVLDGARFELRRDEERIAVEPQVLTLLLLLVANQDRMVSRDEIIDKVWDGRIVSESAISARIKAARKAIGDDGKRQALIRTVHGRGFRFVGQAVAEAVAGLRSPGQVATPLQDASPGNAAEPTDNRPSIAVLPFDILGDVGTHAIVADALPADIIMDLSRMHWLMVIARGSSFRLRGGAVGPQEIGQRLGVRYCLTGTVELSGQQLIIGVSLVETVTRNTIWSEQYRAPLAEVQQMRAVIEESVVAALAVQIPQNEVRRARTRPASELDAWASFHLGLDHMYRFTLSDNTRAAALFEQSIERDPYFSGAFAGLSFTHFQNAFMRYRDEPQAEIERARDLAQQAVEIDRLDPFAHYNMGRCLWLEGKLDQSISLFDQATSLSPNFAQSIYNRGLVGAIAGHAEAADRDLETALRLSPIDPLSYAMVSSRALTHVQFGDYAKAAEFGVRAATMPGAHKHIELIAAFTSHLAGRTGDARQWLDRARKKDPSIGANAFFTAFPYAQTAAREVIERALSDLGA